MSENHKEIMAIAVRLAVENVDKGGGPFGAVIAKDGNVISTGANKVTVKSDPTAHAEIEAIRDACAKLRTHDLSGHVIYTSCEPCPMCLSAIYWAGILTIYYSSTKEHAEAAGFRDKFILDEIRKNNSEKNIQLIKIEHEESGNEFIKWKDNKEKLEY